MLDHLIDPDVNPEQEWHDYVRNEMRQHVEREIFSFKQLLHCSEKTAIAVLKAMTFAWEQEEESGFQCAKIFMLRDIDFYALSDNFDKFKDLYEEIERSKHDE